METHKDLGCKFYRQPIAEYDKWSYAMCRYEKSHWVVFKCGYCSKTWEESTELNLVRKENK